MADVLGAGTSRRTALRAAATIVVSGIITVALLFASRSTASTAADMPAIELGLPLAWVVQDQAYLNPASYPYEVSFLSPWEHPTTVGVPMMLANMAIISAALWLLLLAWRRLPISNRRSSR